MSEQIEEGQLYKWIDICLEDEDIADYEVDPPEASEKGEGYATKVFFVNVRGSKRSNGKNNDLSLVFKVSRIFKGDLLNSMGEMYKKEMIVYDKLFPKFKIFTKGKKTSEVFQSVPKCVKTFSVDDRDIVVLENLRISGYEAHDRMLPMNINHIKLILENYAKFHAITYAFRDQKPKEFANFFSSYSNVYSSVINNDFRSMYQQKIAEARDMINEVNTELAKKMDTILEKGATEILEEIFQEKVKQSTVTHGDCWNCNFLFKYKDGDKTSPTNAIILDWQLSSIHSPAIDLSYFLFAVSSTEQVAKFEDLLKFYYQVLSDSIRDLGSDPEIVFSFSQFYEQWKKYSIVGLILTITFLALLLSDKNDIIEFDDFADAEDLMKSINDTSRKNNSSIYFERILATTKYYFDLVEQ